MQSSMIQIQEYFKCHLRQKFWQSLDKETQSAAVKMAEDDIMLAIGSDKLDIGDLLIFCAVCEQALYLAEYYLQSAGSERLKSESIEGVGKREYYEQKNSRKGLAVELSPRSELFLSRLPGFGAHRFSRG